MLYNFDKVIDRRNTCNEKWDAVAINYGDKDILPMWVADMDFPAPWEVTDAICKRAEHGIFGYTQRPPSFYQAFIDWIYRRHQWKVEKEWIVFSPGIVPALNICASAFTNPGDRILVQSPVYPPFLKVAENNKCELVLNMLKYENGHYEMDFEDIEKKMADPQVKMMILCSPHNPVGRVWTREEMSRICELCFKYDVLLVSDEIHSDIVYRGYKHVPAGSISDDCASNIVTCFAPSKTFNIPGLSTSLIVIPNPEIRQKFQDRIDSIGIGMTNVFGIVAAEAAYTHGEKWLEEMLDYLQGNLEFLTAFIQDNMPQVKIIRPESTYLVWLDFRQLDIDPQKLNTFLLEKAKVWLSDGMNYGPGGEGFQRINIGCPRSILAEGLKRIAGEVMLL